MADPALGAVVLILAGYSSMSPKTVTSKSELSSAPTGAGQRDSANLDQHKWSGEHQNWRAIQTRIIQLGHVPHAVEKAQSPTAVLAELNEIFARPRTTVKPARAT